MSDDFQRVKSALNILQVITQETGLAMRGKHLESCPFCGHRECFSISPEKGLYHCFSGSYGGEGGDVFTSLQKYKNLSKVESLKYATQLAGTELERSDCGRGPRRDRHSGIEDRDRCQGDGDRGVDPELRCGISGSATSGADLPMVLERRPAVLEHDTSAAYKPSTQRSRRLHAA